MITGSEKLRPTEVAAIMGVKLKEVQRAIDEHILPEPFVSRGGNGRHVLAAACVLLWFYYDTKDQLTPAARRKTMVSAADRLLQFESCKRRSSNLKDEWTIFLESHLPGTERSISVDFSGWICQAHKALERLSEARDLVISDPRILGGMPVIRGTRVPVYDVAASVQADIPMERLLEAYPSLDRKTVELAKLYADANPPAGRPRATRLPAGATLIAEKRVPRRAKAS